MHVTNSHSAAFVGPRPQRRNRNIPPNSHSPTVGFAICHIFVLGLHKYGGRPHHCRGRGYRRTRHCCGASQGALLFATTSRRSSCCCSSPHLPLCLQVGFPVKVLEKSSDLREEGASINIAVNGWRAMDALGVSDILRKQFCRIERYIPCLSCKCMGQTRQH